MIFGLKDDHSFTNRGFSIHGPLGIHIAVLRFGLGSRWKCIRSIVPRGSSGPIQNVYMPKAEMVRRFLKFLGVLSIWQGRHLLSLLFVNPSHHTSWGPLKRGKISFAETKGPRRPGTTPRIKNSLICNYLDSAAILSSL